MNNNPWSEEYENQIELQKRKGSFLSGFILAIVGIGLCIYFAPIIFTTGLFALSDLDAKINYQQRMTQMINVAGKPNQDGAQIQSNPREMTVSYGRMSNQINTVSVANKNDLITLANRYTGGVNCDSISADTKAKQVKYVRNKQVIYTVQFRAN
jgi:hypothetical protein